MSKKPDVPCVGCGRLLWGGSSSLPAGQRMCRPCRRVRRCGQNGRLAAPVRCAGCGREFRPWRRQQLACSRECRSRPESRVAWSANRRPCASCPVEVVAPRAYCPTCVAQRRRAHWRQKNAVRRGAPKVGPALSLTDLGARDGWRCHLCSRRVDPALRSPHPRSGSFDHLIPVSAGGVDAPENLRLAHRVCNSRRGARGTVQLLLVG